MKPVVVVLALVAAVVAVSAANFVLLDYGSSADDQVGRLTPRVVGAIGGTVPVDDSSGPSRSHGSDDDGHGSGQSGDDD